MDGDIITKERVLECIKCTNRVINKWVKNHNIPLDKITQQEVISIFKGNIKAKLIHYLPDFKRVSKSIRVDINNNNDRFIKNIYIMDNGYVVNKNQISNINSIVSKLTKKDYDNCTVFEDNKNIFNNNIDHFNLDSIKTIKF